MHLLYKFKRVLFIYLFWFFIYYTSWYSFEISDFMSCFDFLNHFGFKRFGLILI